MATAEDAALNLRIALALATIRETLGVGRSTLYRLLAEQPTGATT